MGNRTFVYGLGRIERMGQGKAETGLGGMR